MIIVFLATFAVLVTAGFLLAAVGGSRRRRRKPLPSRGLEALPAGVGATLRELLEHARKLQAHLLDARQDGLALLNVELAVGDHGRRPLWRQLEDVHHGDALEAASASVDEWVRRFDALQGADRELMLELGLEVVALREPISQRFGQPGPGSTGPARLEALRSAQRWLDEAIAELDHFDAQLAGYRPRLYR